MNSKTLLLKSFGWIFALLFSFIGFVNTFWGNDPVFGASILVLSLIYYPPLHRYFEKIFKISIPKWIKILIGLGILWTSLGVGELFDKIVLMRQSL